MSTDWFVRTETGLAGPFSTDQLRELAKAGRITAATLIRRGTTGEWVRAADAKKLLHGNAENRTTNPPAPLATSEQSEPPVVIEDTRSPVDPTIIIAGIGGGVVVIVLLIGGLFLFLGGRGSKAQATVPKTEQAQKSTQEEAPSALSENVPQQTSRLTTEDLVARSEGSVAYIKGRLSSGTGFLVRDKILVTNKHVIASELVDSLKVHFPSAESANQGPFSAKLLFEDETKDIAVLQVETSLKPLPVAQDYKFRRGQEVIVIGNPGLQEDLVLQNAISKGVMSTETTIDGQMYYQLGISINGGNSGGPVFDPRGRVIGVVTLKASEKEGLGFCIPLAELRESIARLDGLTHQEIASTEAKHRIRVVFLLVGTTGDAYSKGMEVYTDAMEIALSKNVDVNVGVAAVKDKVQSVLARFDQVLMGDLDKQVARISVDNNLSETVRHKFVDLWTNYLELKSYVENPRGNYDSYKLKLNELSDKHKRLTESLKLLLGV